METKVKKLKENNIELTVSVDSATFNESITRAYKSIAKKVSIPGFRKGKVPKNIIDQRVGKDAVYEEAIKENISDYYIEALDKSKVEPIDKPDIQITGVDDKKGLSFVAKIQVKPEVELGDYKKLDVKKEEAKVSEADVEKQIEVIKDKFASIEPVKGKPAEKGDYLIINFDGTVDGKEFEGGSAKDFMLEIGSNTLLPDFEKGLEGSKEGDIKEVGVTIPENYPKKDIAGKNAKFKVLVKEVKNKKLPEINDDFVKEQLGEFKSVDELKKEIRNDLKEQNEKLFEQQYQAKVLDAVAEKAKVKIPQIMIEDEINHLLSDFEYGLKVRGASLEDYYKMTGSDEKTMRENFKKEAEIRVKRNLVIDVISKKEKIDASEKEIAEEIDKIYKSGEKKDKSVEEFKKELESKGLLDYLKASLRHRKTLDFLVNQAQSNVRKKEGV